LLSIDVFLFFHFSLLSHSQMSTSTDVAMDVVVTMDRWTAPAASVLAGHKFQLHVAFQGVRMKSTATMAGVAAREDARDPSVSLLSVASFSFTGQFPLRIHAEKTPEEVAGEVHVELKRVGLFLDDTVATLSVAISPLLRQAAAAAVPTSTLRGPFFFSPRSFGAIDGAVTLRMSDETQRKVSAMNELSRRLQDASAAAARDVADRCGPVDSVGDDTAADVWFGGSHVAARLYYRPSVGERGSCASSATVGVLLVPRGLAEDGETDEFSLVSGQTLTVTAQHGGRLTCALLRQQAPSGSSLGSYFPQPHSDASTQTGDVSHIVAAEAQRSLRRVGDTYWNESAAVLAAKQEAANAIAREAQTSVTAQAAVNEQLRMVYALHSAEARVRELQQQLLILTQHT
jgi:hypothetical protein